MRDLLELRDEIDEIDSEIVALYERRMEISQEVAEYKISVGKAVFDKEREQSKLKVLGEKVHTNFLKHGVQELFEQIMSMSRKRQYQLLTEHGQVEPLEFEEVDGFTYKDAKIVFQGTEGAYSQLAMQEFFGENIDSWHVDTWRDAMEAIKNGEADYAVLPIENSSAGIVSENYDLLVEYDNCIVGEQIIKIDHALLALPGAIKEDITDIYSHPQALMQCSGYFAKHPELLQRACSSTSGCAKEVAESGDVTKAAIASEIAANRISKSKKFINIVRVVALFVAAFGILCNIAGLELGNLWAFSDLGNILIVFFNVPIVYVGAKYVMKATKHFKANDGTPFTSEVVGRNDCVYWDALAEEKFRRTQLQNRILESIAKSYVNCKNVVHFEEGLEPGQVRLLADQIASVCTGYAAVFSGGNYCLASRTEDLRTLAKAMNEALSGRGGGKPAFQQGSVRADQDRIRAFFQDRAD